MYLLFKVVTFIYEADYFMKQSCFQDRVGIYVEGRCHGDKLKCNSNEVPEIV